MFQFFFAIAFAVSITENQKPLHARAHLYAHLFGHKDRNCICVNQVNFDFRSNAFHRMIKCEGRYCYFLKKYASVAAPCMHGRLCRQRQQCIECASRCILVIRPNARRRLHNNAGAHVCASICICGAFFTQSEFST